MEARFQSMVHGDLLCKDAILKCARNFFKAEERELGSYLEFGVLNGSGIVSAYGGLRGTVARYYGFDTFFGLPELNDVDREGLPMMPQFHPGNFKSMSRQMVTTSILAQTNGLQEHQLELVEGEFGKSLPYFDKQKIRKDGPVLMINVDCDLYSSSVDVFDFIDDLVEDGTWLLLDDYWTYRGSPKLGQRRAFEEWIARSELVGATEYATYNGFSKAFILYRK